MRSVKSAFVLVALAAVGGCVVVACSADGTSPEITGTDSGGDSTPGTPDGSGATPDDMDSGDQPDTTTQPVEDSGHDAYVTHEAGKDTGPHDTGVDARDAQLVEAGGDAGPAGSACATKDSVQKQTCGFCGFQTRVCEPNTDGGANVWQQWGFCQAEVAQGCLPGSTASEACGLCGTRQKICQNDCNFAVGACQNQPPNACSPGSTDFEVGLSCDAGGRTRTCASNCTYGGFSGCFVPDGGVTGASLTVPPTVGGINKGQFQLDPMQTAARLGAFGSCPSASISTTDVTSYQYVQIVNTTSMTATISVWGGKVATAGASDIDTIMAAYAGPNLPITPAQRTACTVGVTDSCFDSTDPTACQASWAGLMKSANKQVTVGPFGSVFIYTAAYYTAASGEVASGDYQLSVRTETIQ